MMKTEKKVPELRFPEYSENWKWCHLFKVSTKNISYGIVQTGDEIKGGIPCVRVVDLTNGEIKRESLITTSDKISNSYKKTILEKDELMIALRGVIGLTQKVKDELVGCNLTRGIARVAPNHNYFCSSYLSHYLNSDKVRKIFDERKNGSALKEIPISELKKIPIHHPSLPEQKKIANYLTKVNKRINLLTQKKEKLEQYKKGIMQQIFSQQLRFKDENGKDYPEWEEKRLGDTIKLLSDYTANGSFAGLKENVTYYSEENYAALVRTTDLEKPIFKPERFTDKHGYDFLKKTSLWGGEIILANVGSIGKVYRVPSYNKPMTLAPNTYVIKFNSAIDENFIYQLMNRQFFKNQLLSMVGSTTLKAINKENLRSIVVEIPYIEEQQKIASFLSNIDNKISLVNQQIELTRKWKQGLLQKMFV